GHERRRRARPEGPEAARAHELLEAVAIPLTDVDVACAVHANAPGPVELAIARPERAPLGQEGAVGRGLLDAVAAILADIDGADLVDRDRAGLIELSVTRSR